MNDKRNDETHAHGAFKGNLQKTILSLTQALNYKKLSTKQREMLRGARNVIEDVGLEIG